MPRKFIDAKSVTLCSLLGKERGFQPHLLFLDAIALKKRDFSALKILKSKSLYFSFREMLELNPIDSPLGISTY